jgi:hypothetical protein
MSERELILVVSFCFLINKHAPDVNTKPLLSGLVRITQTTRVLSGVEMIIQMILGA